MDQTHIHLLINHLPVLGAAFGAFVLAYGLWAGSRETQNAAYLVFIIASIGSAITYFTGEAAEETVENIQGISKDLIEQHEESAGIAFGALIVLGIAAIIGLFITRKKASFSRSTAWIILIISVISFGIIAQTAYLGGQIRHTEIGSAAADQTQPRGGDND